MRAGERRRKEGRVEEERERGREHVRTLDHSEDPPRTNEVSMNISYEEVILSYPFTVTKK